jgi:hypothetical protein
MSAPERDGMAIVVKSLFVTALVMITGGMSLIFATDNKMIGVLVVGAGAVDAVMALILSKRS